MRCRLVAAGLDAMAGGSENDGAAGPLWPSLAMVAASVIWGSMWYPLRAVEAAGIPAFLTGAVCYGVPLLPLLPTAFVRRRQLVAGGWRLLLVGASLALCNILFAAAIVKGEVGIVVLLFYLSPIWSTVLERVFMHTSLTASRLTGIALAMVGMGILFGFGGRLPFPSGPSEWMGLVAGLCWAIALLTTRMWSSISLVDKSITQFGCALPAGLAVFALSGPVSLPPASVIVAAAPWILAAGFLWVLPAMAFSLWGAARLSPGRASILMTSEVVVGIGTAAWLAGETLNWHKVLGGILIVSASLLETWPARLPADDGGGKDRS